MNIHKRILPLVIVLLALSCGDPVEPDVFDHCLRHSRHRL